MSTSIPSTPVLFLRSFVFWIFFAIIVSLNRIFRPDSETDRIVNSSCPENRI